MPHVLVQYTPNLDADIPALCRDIADVIVSLKDDAGGALYPVAGTRVLAYPATHFAVADGADDYAFLYVNARIAAGRSDAAKKATGDALAQAVKSRLAAQLAARPVGITVQIDESPGQVFDAKIGNLHGRFGT